MAILDALPGLSVSISIAGKDLPEYENRDEEIHGPLATKTVLRYIQSISDSEFVINFRISPPFQLDCPVLEFRVSIDGTPIRGAICLLTHIKYGCWNYQLLGDKVIHHDGSGELRKFKFASLKTGIIYSRKIGLYHY